MTFLVLFYVFVLALGLAFSLGAFAKTNPRPTMRSVTRDVAADGPEVDIIRREMITRRSEFLFWKDPATHKVLPRPMTIGEIFEARG